MGTTKPAFHPARGYKIPIKKAEGRARAAVVALAFSVASSLIWSALSIAGNREFRHFAEVGEMPTETIKRYGLGLLIGIALQAVLSLTTVVLFLRWFYLITGLTRSLGNPNFWCSPWKAVASFFIPIVNFTRPYTIASNIRDLLEPGAVPEPPVRAQPDEDSYRETHFEAPPPPVPQPRMWISAWWACFVGHGIFAAIVGQLSTKTLDALATFAIANTVSELFNAVTALLAILVVRGLTARLLERHRRVRHNTAEALDEAGIVILPAE